MSTNAATAQSDRDATRERLRVWQESQPLLEEQRWRELQALTDSKALWLTRALFSRRLDYRPKRDSSGLVEQQALFRRAYAK
jgi:hypothetical protein